MSRGGSALTFRNRILGGCLVAVLTIGVAACGSSSKSSGGSSGAKTVSVYSSLPLQGASKDQTNAMVKGMELALSQANNKAGDVTVKYTSLDDSTAQAGAWDPQQTASDARKAAQDKSAVAYIGEFNSGASVISVPILNQVGIAQISPANTYVGLTTSEPGSVKGEPQKYYPTGKRTYARIVPRDSIQAAALITQMKQDGCTKIAVANDKETYGAGLATLLEIKAKAIGATIVSNTPIQKDAPNFRSYAQKIKGQGADCFVFSGVTANGAIQINKDVAAALPNAKLYGPDGICESGFTNPSKKGIPAAVGKRFKCTVATLNLSSYPGGRDFLAAYKAKYGDAHPDPYAIYGYEAMKLVLDTIKAAGPAGTTRDGFLTQLFKTKDRSSVLGTYSIDKNGDTSLTDYGLYNVGSDGNPTFVSTIKAQGAA
ncbi:MAG: branched-chain amino acid transport system substrate-binding protein [Solirubrobacteraceae bacterium]|nr:branched-chain amino acid transport system substrate-binding protein [Solirubrobacteraceae bacterium]